MIPSALLFAGAAILLVGAYRRVALRHGWLDIPNMRSSHRGAVPRGAGVAIVLLAVAAAAIGATPPAFFTSLLPGLGVAAIGWWDDLRGLPARVRFAGYGACSLLALLLLDGGAVPASLLGWVWLGLCGLGLLWLINLYNFMDGINGLATLEAVFVLAGGLALSPYSPLALQLAPFQLYLLAILIGFLGWNFPRARVFMGDVGSAFLGFLLGLVALWSHFNGGPTLVVWSILGAAFIADATFTLAIRITTGQRWYEAHRSHAYQKLTSRWQDVHARTVGAFMGINIAWLLPIAWAAHHGYVSAAAALLMAYIPLLVICRTLKAGIPVATTV
jgi:Fuc2NAc and GlcNAc transferase